LYSKLGEKYASIDTAVTRDSNGVIQSNVTISADQITALTDKIDARAANVTVKSLSAKSSRSSESDPYNEVLINGTAGIQIVPNRPTNYTPSTRFNLDGSGYLANGNFSWDTNGNINLATANNTPSTQFKVDGSGYVANGYIQWDTTDLNAAEKDSYMYLNSDGIRFSTPSAGPGEGSTLITHDSIGIGMYGAERTGDGVNITAGGLTFSNHGAYTTLGSTGFSMYKGKEPYFGTITVGNYSIEIDNGVIVSVTQV